jgi:hypothetical protein
MGRSYESESMTVHVFASNGTNGVHDDKQRTRAPREI